MTKNNYKRLGDYIKRVDVRNTENLDIPLMGLSIQKCFIPSIANTIGTNMRTYKIIERDQFAYGPVTSRNGDKITIALFDDYDKALISQAYIPFKIKDKEKLLPKYLMMWFSRPEFDRYARFKSHGSARETFDWDEMCDVELPIPSIEKQRQIVADYQAVENKIKTNEAICEKLEETAQTIYRRWFVNGIDEDGLPEGWRISTIGKEVETLGGGTPSTKKEEYWNNGNILWFSPTDITNNDSVFISNSGRKISKKGLAKSSAKLFPAFSLMMTSRATIGKIAINTLEATTNQGFITIIPNEELRIYFLYCWIKTQIEEVINLASGSTFKEISRTDFRDLEIIIPDSVTVTKFESKITANFKLIENIIKENQKLHQLQALLLGRMTREEEIVVGN